MTFNILNANSDGLLNNLGSGSFSTDTTQPYNILAGDSSNGISNISPGTSGQILTSNGASANASFQNIPVLPYLCAFSVYLKNRINNVTGDGTTYTIIYDTIVVNIGSAYSASTGLFTAPANGAYLFGYQILTYTTASYVSAFSQYHINASYNYKNNLYNVPTRPTNCVSDHSIILSLSAGDTVGIAVTVQCAPSAKNVSINESASESVNRTASFWGFRIS